MIRYGHLYIDYNHFLCVYIEGLNRSKIDCWTKNQFFDMFEK